ncbi:MAG: rhomboid family intramembrane serine protease [Bacteroidales bacterium]|nr:rhomboid family intramembrane serine protease [Bacteroidales bacterium]
MMRRQDVISQLTTFFRSRGILPGLLRTSILLWAVVKVWDVVAWLLGSSATGADSYLWDLLALHSDFDTLLYHPWSLVTWLVLHDRFWSLLIDLVLLYWSGTLCSRLMGMRRMGWTFFITGAVGGAFFLLAYACFPALQWQHATAAGCLASIMGLCTAAATRKPDHKLNFGLRRRVEISLKWVVVALIVADLLTSTTTNIGVRIAHVGGALCGFLWVKGEQWVNQLRQARPKRRKPATKSTGRPVSDEEYNQRRADDQKRVDALLDKISRSGYNSLSRDEKDFLFHYSSK